MNGKGHFHMVSNGTEQQELGNCSKDHLCYKGEKNLTALCTWLSTLRTAEFRGNELRHLAEEITKQQPFKLLCGYF